MDAQRELSLRSASMSDREKLAITAAAGIAFGYFASLAAKLVSGTWIIDAHGRPIMDDFVAFWAAGHLALAGKAVSAYNPAFLHMAEESIIGHSFSGLLEWSYPPLFLFVAAALASLPYALSFVVWCVATLALHAGVVSAIAKNRAAFFVALAAPWVLTALTPGQNGFLTASIIGLSLLQLEKRPAFVGIVLGLLSFKPQLGILFPLALAAGGYWRAFLWAAIATLGWNGLACAVFGTGTLVEFVHALGGTTQSHFVQGGVDWSKIQSLYALMRSLGVAASPAWAAQALLSALTASFVLLTWRASAPFALKAAALAAAIPLATPYLFVYDLPVLAIVAAFLFRHRAFDKVEASLLAFTLPAVYLFLWAPVPSAFFASVAVAAIAVRRLMGDPSLRADVLRPLLLSGHTSAPTRGSLS